MARWTVTGGAGFIGSNIVAALRALGERVTVLDDLSSGYEVNLSTVSPGAVRESLDPGLRSGPGSRQRGGRRVPPGRVGGQQAQHRQPDPGLPDQRAGHARRARGLPSRRRAQGGTQFLGGHLRRTEDLPIREDHPVEPDTPYGASKLAGEKHCLAYGKLYDLESVVPALLQRLRPQPALRPVRQRHSDLRLPAAARRAASRSSAMASRPRDFVSVHDVVEANLRAAASDAGGAFNIASGTRITINELARLVAN